MIQLTSVRATPTEDRSLCVSSSPPNTLASEGQALNPRLSRAIAEGGASAGLFFSNEISEIKTKVIYCR